MNRHLHIICLDVPWPADYGGAIDMMNKIKMLHQSGIKIHLHYFSYNERGKPEDLNQFCETVNVYERKTGWKGFSFSTPYIVQSRINHDLINNLNQDNYPILIEGIHCTGILRFIERNRKIVVRMHNDEAEYYKELSRSTSRFFKKIYYRFESRLLKKYSKKLPRDIIYACISQDDTKKFLNEYYLTGSKFLPAFISWQTVASMEGIGDFSLYQANLSVAENEKAAAWLIKKVFSQLQLKFVIAGKKPSKRLIKLIRQYANCSLVADPSEKQMNDLVANAQINVLPSLNKNATGIKLKLLHAVFQGRHCITNDAIVSGTDLEPACHVGTNANAFASLISQLFHQPFTNEEIVLRRRILGEVYDNKKNAEQLIAWLY